MDGAGRRAVAALGAVALGCETGEMLNFSLNPFASTTVRVEATEAHGPYLFTRVQGSRIDLRFAAPSSAECKRVLERGASVVYAKSGVFGRIMRDEEGCDAVGSLSLADWRDRHPRPRTGPAVIPRSTARYAVAYRDAQWVLLRGRFPLASLIGIRAAQDVVAVVPADEICRAAVAAGEASLEFRVTGPNAFRLLAGNTPCRIEGFAMPVEGLPASPSAP